MRSDDIGGGCILPLAQAVITAVLVGLLAYGGLTYAAVTNAILAAFTIGVGAGAAVWLSSLMTWQRVAYPETFSPIEYAQESQTTEPATVRLELTQDAGRQTQFIDLPASVEQLSGLARGLLTGATFAESQWTGTGGIFTRAQFAALRAELIRRGLAAWNSPGTPARGVTLTRAGQAAMQHFAQMTDAPPPPADVYPIRR